MPLINDPRQKNDIIQDTHEKYLNRIDSVRGHGGTKTQAKSLQNNIHSYLQHNPERAEQLYHGLDTYDRAEKAHGLNKLIAAGLISTGSAIFTAAAPAIPTLAAACPPHLSTSSAATCGTNAAALLGTIAGGLSLAAGVVSLLDNRSNFTSVKEELARLCSENSDQAKNPELMEIVEAYKLVHKEYQAKVKGYVFFQYRLQEKINKALLNQLLQERYSKNTKQSEVDKLERDQSIEKAVAADTANLDAAVKDSVIPPPDKSKYLRLKSIFNLEMFGVRQGQAERAVGLGPAAGSSYDYEDHAAGPSFENQAAGSSYEDQAAGSSREHQGAGSSQLEVKIDPTL